MSPQSSSAAERISLTTYNRCRGCYEIVTKTMPPFVSHTEFYGGTVTGLEWKEFCHVLDTKLQPINRLRCAIKIIVASTVIVLLALFVFTFVGYDQDTQSYFEEHRWFEVFPILLVLLFITGIAFVCYTAAATKKAFLDIELLCEEQSKILATTTRVNSSILFSFHLCDQRSNSSLHIQSRDMAYTGNDYYHHPFRTYHNVYVLALATMVDPENGVAPSMVLPVKFPTIEFNTSDDTDDESTLGDDTLYTSMDAMTTIGALRLSIAKKQDQQELKESQVRQTAPGNPVKKKKKAEKGKKSKENTEKDIKKTSKKNRKKKAGSDRSERGGSDNDKPKHKKGNKNATKGKKGKKKDHTIAKEDLGTIAEASYRYI